MIIQIVNMQNIDTVKFTRMIPKPNFGWLHLDLQLITLGLFLICLLPLASNNKLRYHGCFIVYILIVSIVAILLLPVFLLRPLNVRNSKLAASILRHISKLVGIQWELRKGEIIEQDRGVVIVSNHQSMFDVLGMFNFWHVMDKCAAIAKKEIFYVWPFGLVAWLGGVVFIDRLNGKLANQQLFDVANTVFKNKTKIWIFPEGTRNRKRDTLLPFKRGAFRLAIACQVPVIPIVFSPYYFVNDKKKYFGRGRITVTCLEPVPTEGLTENDIDSLMNIVRDVMVDQYEKSKEEVLSTQEDYNKFN